MACVHDQHEADQRVTRRDVAPEEILPAFLQRTRHRRVAITGKVGDDAAAAQVEEVDLLRAPRRAVCVCEPRLARQRVDGARFARIRPARERDLARTGASERRDARDDDRPVAPQRGLRQPRQLRERETGGLAQCCHRGRPVARVQARRSKPRITCRRAP